MTTRIPSEIERCALTMLANAKINNPALYEVRKQFMDDSGTDAEHKWENNWETLRSVTPTEPTGAQWYAEMRAEAASQGEINEARYAKDLDTAAAYLIGNIISHRIAERDGETGDRTHEIGHSGIAITTSLAANVCEYHARVMNSQAAYLTNYKWEA